MTATPTTATPTTATPTVRRRVLALWLACALFGSSACGARAAPDAQVRLDQVGYASGETKIAMLLAPRDAADAHATVVDDRGHPVFTAAVGRRRAAWNARFTSVHPVDLSGLRTPGTYRLRISGAVRAESPPFRIGPPAQLFGPLVDNAVRYLQAHRDGADQVPGAWQRTPAHLDDRQADVYEAPEFDDEQLTGPMHRVDGPVDVEGGWYDAGDYLKFTHTTAYALIALLLVQRDGPVPAGLPAEAAHGLRWLDKMVDEDTGTLLLQVGIGSGTPDLLGDHDVWRLPQADDALDVESGDRRYYLRHRPVFTAGAPGDPLSPNLAGRVAAAFALAAQVHAADDPDLARRHLDTAAGVFDRAATSADGDLVTSRPRGFYPETRWTDDLALGGAELALAGARLADPRTVAWARDAAHWAHADADGGSAALSVYDVGPLADAELIRSFGTTPVPDADITADDLRRDLRRRLDDGVAAAARDPFGAADGTAGSDYAAQQLGYAATAALYGAVSGDGSYAAFGTAQRAVALGANGWGTSLVVGAGTTYPRCPHDQIASLTPGGDRRPMTGAVVNGPHTADRIAALHTASTPSPCATSGFTRFDRDDARYTDDVRVSATSEPALDFTATGMLAFALTARS